MAGGGMMTEAQVVREVLVTLGARPDCLVRRRNVGKARDPKTGQVVTFGTQGEADVEVTVRGGREVFLECKSATGRQRPEQVAFQRRVTSLGAIYRVVR